MKNVWLTYHEKRRYENNGWFIYVIRATITSPADQKDKDIWRFALNRNDRRGVLENFWQDKNPRGRKFETRYFASLAEAKEAAFKLSSSS